MAMHKTVAQLLAGCVHKERQPKMKGRQEMMSIVSRRTQQEPHMPWFFTGVTAPTERQSTIAGASTSECRKP